MSTRLLTMAAIALTASPLEAHEADFDGRVRAFLLENPEVILQALEELTAREETARLTAQIARHAAMFDAPAGLGLGAPDAPIRVIEFFDYRCAPCKAIHPALSALVDQSPDLRIEMLQLPILSPGSERAARFALAARDLAGPTAYADVHAALWALRGPLNAAGFKQIADTLGLDFAALEAEMYSDTISAEITRNRDIAIDLGILGTPAFVTPTSVQFGGTDVAAMSRVWLSR